MTRATLNHVFHFKTEGRRSLLLLGQLRIHEGASKSWGWGGVGVEGTCERLQMHGEWGDSGSMPTDSQEQHGGSLK